MDGQKIVDTYFKLRFSIFFLLTFAAVFSFVIIPVYGADPFDEFVFQGVLKDSGGALVTATKDITLKIYTVLSGGTSLWEEEHDNVSVSNGIFTVFAGSVNSFANDLNFTNAYFLEIRIEDINGNNPEILSPRIKIGGSPFSLSSARASVDFDLNKKQLFNATSINATSINATSINAISLIVNGQAPCLANGTNCQSTDLFHDKTSTTYTSNLSEGGFVGYEAGNFICSQEFPGTHLCHEAEIILTIHQKDISTLSEWSGSAWVSTGGAKFSPATLPANDCNGFTHGTADSFLGNFWLFNQVGGGVGGVGQCANTLPLACCKGGG